MWTPFFFYKGEEFLKYTLICVLLNLRETGINLATVKKRMKKLKISLSIGILAVLAVAQAHATVIVTYAEQPGQMTSTFIHATTEDFNNLSSGLHATATWNDSTTGELVGTFTSLNIKTNDQYGGADNTKYAVTGLGVNTKTTLNLAQDSSYFGMWWSAGDAKNVIDFYSEADGKGTLLAEFTTANLLKALSPKTVYPNGYYGNPNTGSNYQKDSGEPFAFINFFAVEGTQWASVVITNNGSSGFESDNYASRVIAYNSAVDGAMPGNILEAIDGTTEVSLTQTPEPSTTLAMFLLGGLTFGGSFLRRFQKRA